MATNVLLHVTLTLHARVLAEMTILAVHKTQPGEQFHHPRRLCSPRTLRTKKLAPHYTDYETIN
jgi:hypothetical protein